MSWKIQQVFEKSNYLRLFSICDDMPSYALLYLPDYDNKIP